MKKTVYAVIAIAAVAALAFSGCGSKEAKKASASGAEFTFNNGRAAVARPVKDSGRA